VERIRSADLVDELHRRMAGVRQYQERLAAVEGTGEAAGGLVRATVGSGGDVRDLGLEPRAMRLTSHSLREALLEAIRLAVEDARAKTAELGEELNRDTLQFADATGMRQELDRMMAGLSRELGDIQQNFEVLMRKLARER
jgi:DNA-binding protein YbaB